MEQKRHSLGRRVAGLYVAGLRLAPRCNKTTKTQEQNNEKHQNIETSDSKVMTSLVVSAVVGACSGGHSARALVAP